MKRKRRQYSGAFKARVALEAMMGVKTVAQLARHGADLAQKIAAVKAML